MTILNKIEEIVARYIPFRTTDCKTIRRKKEWQREQLKNEIIRLIDDTSGTTKA